MKLKPGMISQYFLYDRGFVSREVVPNQIDRSGWIFGQHAMQESGGLLSPNVTVWIKVTQQFDVTAGCM